MKNAVLFTLAALLLLLGSAFDSKGPIGRKIPLLANKTLDGQTIDEGYFKRHITVVSFMYIGCPPCMNEIGFLNQITKEYAGVPRVQILCVARQMRAQMVQFNSDNNTIFSQLRKALGVDPIQYSIQPACVSQESKMDSAGNHVSLKSECDVIEQQFGVTAYPTIFLVDDEGIIRNIIRGGPSSRKDSTFYFGLKKEIDAFL